MIIDEVINELTNTFVTMNGTIWTQISNDKRGLQNRIGMFPNRNMIYNFNAFNKMWVIRSKCPSSVWIACLDELNGIIYIYRIVKAQMHLN